MPSSTTVRPSSDAAGHSAVGHSVPDQGLTLDLTAMGAVRVDPEHKRAHVQGGALLGALDRATQAHGLAVAATGRTPSRTTAVAVNVRAPRLGVDPVVAP